MTMESTVEQALFEALAPRVREASRLCIALSGGLDSTVLLHAVAGLRAAGRLPCALSALHVHHGLSPHADAWAAACAALCGTLGLPLEIVRVRVPQGSGEGPEAAARRVRHQVFAACAADWLALAHHRDDQAETVLLNLMRGAGVAGAAGMPRERRLAGGALLIRPLLGVARPAIRRYADAHALCWVEDESNAERRFRRNFLRHDILPGLDAQFPGASRALVRAGGHFAEAAGLLDELAALDAAAVAMPSGRLGLAAFNRLSPPRARNLLRHAWTEAGFRAPEARWIEEARDQLANTDGLSETCVATPEAELRVYRGELYLRRRLPDAPAQTLRWQGEAALPWAGGRLCFETRDDHGISAGLLAGAAVEVRGRAGGERFVPCGGRPRRSVRKMLQEAAMPPWERARLPLLWVGDRLAWVAGIGVAADCANRPGEPALLPRWEP